MVEAVVYSKLPIVTVEDPKYAEPPVTLRMPGTVKANPLVSSTPDVTFIRKLVVEELNAPANLYTPVPIIFMAVRFISNVNPLVVIVFTPDPAKYIPLKLTVIRVAGIDMLPKIYSLSD
jgi:hypothetical protein